MLSRQDDENLFTMFSHNPHFRSDLRILLRPAEVWGSVKVGDCGSPIETEASWFVITHGDRIILPYAMSVQFTFIASVDLAVLTAE